MENITEKQVLLTPTLAREYLMKNDPRQRAINYGHASTLARDIVRGAWDDRMSEPIDFSVEGYMMNGQHRCMAVVKAGKPILANIRENCPTEWFEKYDRAKPRTVTDYYRGKNAKTCASIATFAVCIEAGSTLWNAIKGRVGHARSGNKSNACIAPTLGEKLDFIIAHEEDLQRCASMGCEIYKVAGFGSKATFGSALFFLENLGADKGIVSDMVEDFCSPAPRNANIAIMKAWYIKRVAEQIKVRMRFPTDMLFSIVLALYEGYVGTTPIKQPKRAIEKAWDKYATIAEEKRGKK